VYGQRAGVRMSTLVTIKNEGKRWPIRVVLEERNYTKDTAEITDTFRDVMTIPLKPGQSHTAAVCDISRRIRIEEAV
jgi:hypothetical protein